MSWSLWPGDCGLAGPEYDATISFGLPFEPEDSQYGEYRLQCVSIAEGMTVSDIVDNLEVSFVGFQAASRCRSLLERRGSRRRTGDRQQMVLVRIKGWEAVL